MNKLQIKTLLSTSCVASLVHVIVGHQQHLSLRLLGYFSR